MTMTLHHHHQDRDPPCEQMLTVVFLVTEGVPPHKQLLMGVGVVLWGSTLQADACGGSCICWCQ
jgi:hypothetical protein